MMETPKEVLEEVMQGMREQDKDHYRERFFEAQLADALATQEVLEGKYLEDSRYARVLEAPSPRYVHPVEDIEEMAERRVMRVWVPSGIILTLCAGMSGWLGIQEAAAGYLGGWLFYSIIMVLCGAGVWGVIKEIGEELNERD